MLACFLSSPDITEATESGSIFLIFFVTFGVTRVSYDVERHVFLIFPDNDGGYVARI